MVFARVASHVYCYWFLTMVLYFQFIVDGLEGVGVSVREIETPLSDLQIVKKYLGRTYFDGSQKLISIEEYGQ